jgi:hypothetical protein
MAVNPSPEPPYNSTAQSSATTQGVALSSSSTLETGVGGGKTNGNE